MERKNLSLPDFQPPPPDVLEAQQSLQDELIQKGARLFADCRRLEAMLVEDIRILEESPPSTSGEDRKCKLNILERRLAAVRDCIQRIQQWHPIVTQRCHTAQKALLPLQLAYALERRSKE